MNYIEKFLHLIDTDMTTPGNYGWFHIMMFAIIVLTTIIFVVAGRNCLEKTFRRTVLWWWIINMILELYIVLMYAYNIEDGKIVWDYAWYMFPFQLCSSPAYTLPFVALLKDGKVRDGFIAYTMTFAFFGGLAVMFYPNDVFVSTIGINIQTMIHHGMQVVMGIFFAVHERHKLTKFFFLRGVPVFCALLAVAMALNVGGYHLFQHLGMDDTFNMFFISPYFECTLPILNMIYPAVPYPVFLCIYIFGFTLIAWLMHIILRGIILGVVKAKKKKRAAC